jgi:hypothetical protein
MAWRIGIAINGNHLDTKPLQRDHHLFAQLTGTKHHDPRGHWT